MKIKVVIAVLAVFLILLGLAAVGLYWRSQHQLQDTVRVLKYEVTKDFHDPDSARFRSVRLQSLEGPIWNRIRSISLNSLWRNTPAEVASVFTYRPELLQLCGEVNAKNAFGAYVGYKAFYISGGEEPVPFIDQQESDDFAKKMCDTSSQMVVFTVP